MGIAKTRHQGPTAYNHAHMLCLNNMADELVIDDLFLSGNDQSDDFDDDSEPSDTCCEFAMVNDQISNIPYELYELPNLKEVLCLETWNLYLTEEERFHLAAFLPDMDQEIFDLTMIELLNGGNFFFGSPLETLLYRLKSGFYSLQVTHFREGLKFLQERLFYHSLRSYHENISQKFANMRKVWKNCQPNTSVTERIEIWKNKIDQKPAFLVDLNMFPLDEEIFSKGGRKVLGPSQVWTACTNEKGFVHVPTADWNETTMNNRTKAKGVLKLKPSKMSSAQKKDVSLLPTETLQPFRWPSKGVLKIKPKVHPTNSVARSNTTAVPLQQSSYWKEENITKNLNFVHHLRRFQSNSGGHSTPELINERQSEDTLNTGSKNVPRKMKTIKRLKMASDDFSGFRERFDGQHKEALWPTSTGQHKPVPDNSQRKLMASYTNASETLSSNLISVNDYLPKYSDHSELRYGDGVETSHMFPVSFKRKKPHTRPTALQGQKMLSIPRVHGLELAVSAGANFKHVEKTKAKK